MIGRVLALVAIAACSSKAAAPPPPKPLAGSWIDWVPVVDGKRAMLTTVVQDDAGVWRCAVSICEHFALDGTRDKTHELPCRVADQAFSPSRTKLAYACAGEDGEEVSIVDLATMDVETRPIEHAFRLAVDDKGAVTGLDYPPKHVERVTSVGKVAFPIAPPDKPGAMSITVEAMPTTGAWLAYSTNAAGGDLAWSADGTPVPLRGAIVDRFDERFLVRTGPTSYVDVSPGGTVGLEEGFPATLAGPTDLRGAEGFRGTDGYFVTYRGVMQVRDRKGHLSYSLPLPDFEAIPLWDPPGTRAAVWYPDGRILRWQAK